MLEAHILKFSVKFTIKPFLFLAIKLEQIRVTLELNNTLNYLDFKLTNIYQLGWWAWRLNEN